ncbi:MAG: RNA polymerase sigma factor [Solirubrobacterales bacterium]|nr:RNA polymerase sigma factor [Solirubrobacterales bacterium]
MLSSLEVDCELPGPIPVLYLALPDRCERSESPGAQLTTRRSRSAFSIDDESGRDIASGTADPARSAQISELRRGLSEAVADLPAGQRQAIVLRDMNGLSAAEAADIMAVGEAAFKSRLHRARLKVRSAVSGLVEGDV